MTGILRPFSGMGRKKWAITERMILEPAQLGPLLRFNPSILLFFRGSFMLTLTVLERKKKAAPKAKILNGDCVNHLKILIPNIISVYVMDIPIIRMENSSFVKKKRKLSV